MVGSAVTVTRFETRPASPGIGQTFAGASNYRPLNVVCVGAHPDDPETGCGGTLAKFIAEGHNVTVIYLTRGEAGLRTSGSEAASRLRTAEALRACELLGATAVFANQIDGQTSTEKERVEQFTALLEIAGSRYRLHALAARHSPRPPEYRSTHVRSLAGRRGIIRTRLLRGDDRRANSPLRAELLHRRLIDIGAEALCRVRARLPEPGSLLPVPREDGTRARIGGAASPRRGLCGRSRETPQAFPAIRNVA